MTLEDKVQWLFLGIVIGYLLQFVFPIRVNQKVKSMHEPAKARFKRIDWRAVAILVVVLLTALSAFKSQQVSNKIQENDKRSDALSSQVRLITQCNSEFLAKTILALNDRSAYSTAQSQANVDLQRSQLRYLTLALSTPPPTVDAGRVAVKKYLDTLRGYLKIATKSAFQVSTNSYPTLEDFNNCVTSKDQHH